MAKQKIKVVVNIPDKEYASELKAKAMADIIAARISKLPYEQQILAYEKIERTYEQRGNER
ncbi:hypothetical protein FQB35_04375 [Crassaminicella thermophila]|uniref:Uncharacterized protein n=1 Tax=Crassaminicella thermophila TaxID=2599308 RepID=A0A5C0SD36_CRATE|nr:hypothetical protein [Crassaminicella thermophila]QEK11656.1 hypothetical protein FQB35_04375 [Crassaminicella thermophila]